MKDMIEIRWHGRGGQGAKTAALLLTDVVFQTGKYVQGFPEYGPERMGAPITAYNRISDHEIRVHSNIYDPDYVIVVDSSLLHVTDVLAGMKEDGALIINSDESEEEIRKHLGGYQGRLYIIDAKKISLATLGRYFPNTPMLAAAVKITGVMDEDEFLTAMEGSFKHKFAKKPEVIEGNMEALRMTLASIQ